MKFVNDTNETLRFSLRGRTHEVAPGGELDVPDRFAYAIAARKLPLRAIGGPEKAPEAVHEPASAEAWRECAEGERKRAEAAEAQVRRLSERLSAMQTEQRKALDAQSTTESDLREQVRAYREEAVRLQGQLDAVTKDRDDLLEAATRVDAEKKPSGKSGGGEKPS